MHGVMYFNQLDGELGNTVVLDVLDHSFNVWRKTKAAWRYVYDNHLSDYDWFLKVDDDTFIIMENLRYMLRSEDHFQPVYFGHMLRDEEFTYLSGYPGWYNSCFGFACSWNMYSSIEIGTKVN